MLIPSFNLPRLADSIEVMNRRCLKLNQPPIRLVVGMCVMEERRHETGLKYQIEMVNVEIIGESPILNGWKLVGIVEEYLQGENMVRCVPGETVPQGYRFTDKHCDHCKTQRRRKEVFVLRHVDGRHVQVGRQCIADFLGHASVESMVARAEWEMSAGNELRDASDENYCCRVEKMIPLGLFVAMTAIVIRRLGWVSRKMVEETQTGVSTAHLVWQVLTSDDEYTKELVENNQLYAEPRDEELAKAAIAWAAGLPTNENTFLYNLGVACRCSSVTYRAKGVVASVIAAYNRVSESEKKMPGIHVGTVGERVEITVIVKKLSYFDSQCGVKTLVRFEAAGNVLIWWASGNTDWLCEGDQVKIVGTVKKHDNYKGTPQTVLTRVRKA